MTDALIGTFASNYDPALDANICFLYHVIGNETGEWSIPVGGMGAVTIPMWVALASTVSALAAGNVELKTKVERALDADAAKAKPDGE